MLTLCLTAPYVARISVPAALTLYALRALPVCLVLGGEWLGVTRKAPLPGARSRRSWGGAFSSLPIPTPPVVSQNFRPSSAHSGGVVSG